MTEKKLENMNLGELVEAMISTAVECSNSLNVLDGKYSPDTKQKLRNEMKSNYQKSITPLKEELDRRENKYKIVTEISIIKAKVDYLGGGGAHIRLPSKRYNEAYDLLCREKIPFEMKLYEVIRAPEFVADHFKSNGIPYRVISEDKYKEIVAQHNTPEKRAKRRTALERKYPLPKKGSGKGCSTLR